MQVLHFSSPKGLCKQVYFFLVMWQLLIGCTTLLPVLSSTALGSVNRECTTPAGPVVQIGEISLKEAKVKLEPKVVIKTLEYFTTG